MTDSIKNEGDRDDPLQLLDQFMDFLKKNTMQFSTPSLEKINSDTGEIESMGRRAESLNSLKGPSRDRKRPSTPNRINSPDPTRRIGPDAERDRIPVPERRKARNLTGNNPMIPVKKVESDLDKDPETESEGLKVPGLDFISSLIPEKMKVKVADVEDGTADDRNRAPGLAGFSAPIPDSKKVMSDVEEIERIADKLEKILNEEDTEPEAEQNQIIRPWDRFLFSMKRSIPPIFGSLALIAYTVVVLRVLFDVKIPKIIQVVANPNHIFLGILVLLIITLIVNSYRRYQIRMKVREMQMKGENPGGEAA